MQSSRLKETGGLKELLVLFIPLSFMTFSNYLFLFIEKILLAQFSVQTMEAAVSAAYVLQIIQIPCIAVALMTQVYVGQWHGAKQFNLIGPGIWQFIWFAGLSMAITVPFGFLFGTFSFQETAVERIVWPYFSFLTKINFLFPLGTTLTCFYLGLGKIRLVLLVTLGSQLLKLICTYILIFGWGDFIPSFGLMGGAYGTLIAQGGFCFILLGVFLNAKHANLYETHNWKLQIKLFLECLYPGLLRSISRLLMVSSWASIARLMTVKGGDYLLILSVGGSLSMFLPFLGDAICQAQLTLLSTIIGARKYSLLNRIFKSGSILAFLIILLLAIPFIGFPTAVFNFLFPNVLLSDQAIRMLFLGVWTSYACFTFCYVPISYVLAFKDAGFLFFIGAFNWINGYFVMYIAIEYVQIRAENFWLTLTIMNGSMALLYYWRMRWLEARALALPQPT